MHRHLVNEASFEILLESTTPLLIKAGKDATVLEEVDMQPVVTFRHGTSQPFIPGSSAKGVLRSYAERIASTLLPRDAAPPLGVCDLFAQSGERRSCSSRLTERKERGGLEIRGGTADAGPRAYRESCPICRLFGSLALLSRFEITDLYSDVPVHLEPRDGVGINRVTGGAASDVGALFNLSVAVGGKYRGTVRVRNFELWQLGLLALVLRDLKQGELTFGMGHSRGLGQVKAELRSARVRLFAPGATLDRLTGVAVLGPKAIDSYGFSADPRERDGVSAGIAGAADDLGLGVRFTYTGEAEVMALLRAVAPVWGDFARARAASLAGSARQGSPR